MRRGLGIVIGLIGSPWVGVDARAPVRGATRRALLAVLATEAGRRVSVHRLVDELWDGRRVSDSSLRVTVNRLRSQLVDAGISDPIRSDPGGYTLDVDRDAVDFLLLERLVASSGVDSRAGRLDDVLRSTSTAMELWTGSPFDGVPDTPTVRGSTVRAEHAYFELVALRADALLRQGEAFEAFEALDVAVPHALPREDLVAMRMIAAARIGRRDVAISAFDDLVVGLREDLGVEPTSGLIELRDAIGVDDPERLCIAETEFLPPMVEAASVRSQPTSDPPPSLVGRDDVVDAVALALARRSVVLVQGDAGYGKTALGAVVAATVASARRSVAWIRGSRLDPGPGSILRGLTDLVDDEDHPIRRLTDIPSSADPELRMVMLADAATAALRTAQPGLVIVDDVHWMDRSALALLAAIIGQVDGQSWLLLSRPHGLRGDVAQFRSDLNTRTSDRVVDVVLDPLTDAEVVELVERRHGAPLERTAAIEVARRCDGWPFLAVELARRLDCLDELPDSVIHAVSVELDAADPTDRELVELVAVAGTLPSSSLRAIRGADDVHRAGRRLERTGLVRDTAGGLSIAHDVIQDAVLSLLDRERTEQLHRAVAALISSSDPTDPVSVVRHLLRGGSGSEAELERLIGPALTALRVSGAFIDASELASEYLSIVGPLPRTVEGLSGGLDAAAALIGGGRVDDGIALYDCLIPRIRQMGDSVLTATAILARGPVDAGGVPPGDLAVDAETVRRSLPTTETWLRPQLGLWCAHQQLIGGGDGVQELLDEVEVEVAESGDEVLRSLLLAERYHASMACDRSPDGSSAAFADLESWARLTGRTPCRSMVRLLALDRAATVGTLDQHAQAIEELDAVIEDFPRPDLEWYVAAARAGAAIAAGDIERAADLVVAAGDAGRRLHLAAAPGVERLHQFLLIDANGSLAAVAPMLDLPFDDAAQPVLVGAAGRAAHEAGDQRRAQEAAKWLAEAPRLLVGAGMGWQMTAVLASELAASTGCEALGHRVRAELGGRSGTGLSIAGVVLLGSVDRALGRAADAVGDGDAAQDLERRAQAWDAAAGHAPRRGPRPEYSAG